MFYYILALVVFLIDQGTKWLIVRNLELRESMSVIGDFFQLTSHRNRGAAFGILQDQRWFFIIVTFVVVIGIVYYLNKVRKENKRMLAVALSLLLGGALGNFLDRAINGEVVDFFQFWFHFTIFGKQIDYIYPIFNVADMAIVFGVLFLLLDSLLSWSKERKEKMNESQGS